MHTCSTESVLSNLKGVRYYISSLSEFTKSPDYIKRAIDLLIQEDSKLWPDMIVDEDVEPLQCENFLQLSQAYKTFGYDIIKYGPDYDGFEVDDGSLQVCGKEHKYFSVTRDGGQSDSDISNYYLVIGDKVCLIATRMSTSWLTYNDDVLQSIGINPEMLGDYLEKLFHIYYKNHQSEFEVLNNEIREPKNVCDMTEIEFTLANKKYYETFFDWMVFFSDDENESQAE